MKRQIDMINGNILSGMLCFALPLMLNSILQVFYNAADTFVVGYYDDPLSMGAVSSAGGVLACILTLFIGISVGVNILAARFYGAGDMNAVKKFGGSALLLGGVFGIFIFIIGQIFTVPLVDTIGIAPEIRQRTIVYMRIYLCGVPFTAVFNFVSAFLQGTGDTKRPTQCLVISGAINVLFNIIFVKYMKWGVAGVAGATVISVIVAFLLVFRSFVKSSVGVSVRDLKCDKNICRNIITMGTPAGLQNLLTSISNVFTTAAMNSFGAAAISGEAIELQLECLVCVGISGISAAIVTFVSQNVGAGNYRRLGKVFKTGFLVEVIYCVVVISVAYVFRHPFVNMFAHGDAEVAKYALIKINYIILPYVTVVIMDVPASMLKGIGQTFPAMLISMGGCVFRVLWILFLLPIPIFHSVEVLFISYPIVWFLNGCVSATVYFVKKKALVQTAETFEKIGETV